MYEEPIPKKYWENDVALSRFLEQRKHREEAESKTHKKDIGGTQYQIIE